METNNLRVFSLEQVKNLHVLGRTGISTGHSENSCMTDNSGTTSTCAAKTLALFWTASGVSVNTTAGEVWALLEGDYSVYEPWASVWVDGAEVSRFIVQKGKQWYCLFRGLPVGTPHVITLLKETQAMSADEKQMLLVHALGVPDAVAAEQVFVPLPQKKCKIEFIGDSITTGEGLAGAVQEMDWITGWMALRDNYALLTAKQLDADFRIFSQSGWGVTGSWDNDRNCAIPNYYNKVCGLVFGARNESFGAHEPYDFASWRPDVVVINLGTNDWGAFNNAAKKDPATGKEWKLHLDANKKPVAQDLAFFTKGVYNFIQQVRRCNPQAQILWVYGMCSFDLGPEIEATVARFAEDTGDTKVHFAKLPCMSAETEDEKGSRQHPGAGTHHRTAKVIAAEIEKLLNA
jgi:lysophospholipase L1-like esterase